MDKRTGRVAAVAVVVVAFFVSAAYAQPMDEGFGGEEKQAAHHQKMFKNLAQELELTAEQQEQMKAQRTTQREQGKQIKEQLKAKRQELKAALDTDEVDQATVDSIVDEITALEGLKLQQHVNGVLTMKEILTPEQSTKLKEKMEEKKEQMRGRRQKMKAHRSGMSQ